MVAPDNIVPPWLSNEARKAIKMYIVFEYEVVTDELLCEITKALGVFNDFWSARQFFHLEADRRALNTQMSLLEKKKGDTGLFLFEKGRGSCLLIDLKMIEEKHQEAIEKFDELTRTDTII